MSRTPISIGERFGRYTVERPTIPDRISRFIVRCDCGAERDVSAGDLRNGSSRSCGCLKRDATAARSTTHGHAGAGGSLSYESWTSAKSRCSNPNVRAYPHYGGRGIQMCDRWKNSFHAFLQDMGERPSKDMTLERINNDGNYEPGNCVWASVQQQRRNTRCTRMIEFQGEVKCLSDWAAAYGLSILTLHSRLGKLGWGIERALTTPPQVGGRQSATKQLERRA